MIRIGGETALQAPLHASAGGQESTTFMNRNGNNGGTGHDDATKTKTFVVDTNVLLHNPAAIFLFAEHDVVIPFDVIEELDEFKSGTDDLGRNARTVIRHLDRLR